MHRMNVDLMKILKIFSFLSYTYLFSKKIGKIVPVLN
jgi:hypothetical protein